MELRVLNRKLKATTVVIGLLALPSASSAERPGTMAIGIGSGTLASGLSGKYVAHPNLTFQANLGSVSGGGVDNRYEDFGGIGASLDVLFLSGTFMQASVLSLDWSVGVGGGIGVRNDTTAAAAAGVAGLELNFRPVPLDLTIEFRPNLLIIPDTEIELFDLTAHLRYWFK